jgi:hypothetical protein
MGNSREELLSRLTGFDEFVESSMKEWKVPGLAFSVVKDSELAYTRVVSIEILKRGNAIV